VVQPARSRGHGRASGPSAGEGEKKSFVGHSGRRRKGGPTGVSREKKGNEHTTSGTPVALAAGEQAREGTTAEELRKMLRGENRSLLGRTRKEGRSCWHFRRKSWRERTWKRVSQKRKGVQTRGTGFQESLRVSCMGYQLRGWRGQEGIRGFKKGEKKGRQAELDVSEEC